MAPRPWRTLQSRPIYSNRWMKLREDIAELPDGRTTIYGVVTFGHCVGVLPFVDREHVLLVRQYRYVQQEAHRWEMPTGGVRAGESLAEAAQRELMEEAGYRAGRLTPFSSYYTSKSICDETAHLFLGEELAPAELPPDETEFFERQVFSFAEALRMACAAEIRDSMTVIALLHAALLRGVAVQPAWYAPLAGNETP